MCSLKSNDVEGGIKGQNDVHNRRETPAEVEMKSSQALSGLGKRPNKK